jgi:transcription elongation factor Elf1
MNATARSRPRARVRARALHPSSVAVLRIAPCPVCRCRKRVLDEEDGVQTLRCLECGEVIRMTRAMSRPVHVTL